MDLEKSVSSRSSEDESEQLESPIVGRRVMETDSEPGSSNRERLTLQGEESRETPGGFLPAAVEGDLISPPKPRMPGSSCAAPAGLRDSYDDVTSGQRPTGPGMSPILGYGGLMSGTSPSKVTSSSSTPMEPTPTHSTGLRPQLIEFDMQRGRGRVVRQSRTTLLPSRDASSYHGTDTLEGSLPSNSSSSTATINRRVGEPSSLPPPVPTDTPSTSLSQPLVDLSPADQQSRFTDNSTGSGGSDHSFLYPNRQTFPPANLTGPLDFHKDGLLEVRERGRSPPTFEDESTFRDLDGSDSSPERHVQQVKDGPQSFFQHSSIHTGTRSGPIPPDHRSVFTVSSSSSALSTVRQRRRRQTVARPHSPTTRISKDGFPASCGMAGFGEQEPRFAAADTTYSRWSRVPLSLCTTRYSTTRGSAKDGSSHGK